MNASAKRTLGPTDAALVASRALVAIAVRSLGGLDDVTLPQFRALVVLASHGPSTSGDLAVRLAVHPSSVTRLVDRLERKGLVARTGTDDRREVRIEVAPAGVELLDEVTAARRRELAKVLRRLPAERRDAVAEAFAEFAAAAGEIPDDDWWIALS
jgi:DNA-binding MarR family transcriptional regulator